MNDAKLKIAVTCSSNMNRSMESHSILSKKGFIVQSFGTAEKVKLPGTAADKPNVYDFSCTYEDIYNDLLNKDKIFYTQNGLLHMLDRNRRIKRKPEKFQESEDMFDLIITCEERVYDQVVDYFSMRPCVEHEIVHVVNVDIQDNTEEATIGAFLICELVSLISKCSDVDRSE